MSRLTDPAPIADPSAQPPWSQLFPFDGTQPNSRHTYDGMAYLNHVNKLWAFSGGLANKQGGADEITWIFDPVTNTWRIDDTSGDIPFQVSGAVSAYDTLTGKVFLHNRKALYSYEYKEGGGVYTLLNDDGQMGLRVSAAIDPVNRKMLIIGDKQQILYDLNPETGFRRQDLPLLGDALVVEQMAPGIAYNERDGNIYAWYGNGKVYRFDMENFSWTSVAYKNGPGRQISNGTFGRFAYSSINNSFVVYNRTQDNSFELKVSEIRDTQPPAKPSGLVFSEPYPKSLLLTWNPSDDNLGVDYYKVYINGELFESTPNTFIKSMNLPRGAEHKATIVAVDSAGNESLPSKPLDIQFSPDNIKFNFGDCQQEEALSGRNDILFCESWDNENWWQDKGYLSDPIVAQPRRLTQEQLTHTQVVDDNCVQGSCLKVDMKKGLTRALSAYWPLQAVNAAPQNLYLRYYIKLADDWNVNMCDADDNVVGAGGKFPGLADVRTWADPSNQCGNGGARGDGINCWSMRANYRDCSSSDGNACATKPNAAARFGSYIYHTNQYGGTGDAGHWDEDDWGQSSNGGGSCSSRAGNMYCGKGDGGVLERDLWYRIEMQVQMNAPGSEDGTIRGWVNGVLSYEKLNVNFREKGHDFLHNRLVWLNVYKGGKSGNCSTSAIYLDQMVVALEQPVGGIENSTALPPELQLTVDNESPESGQTFAIDWQSNNTEQCVASGVWEGEKSLVGSEQLTLDKSGIARLDCSGAGGAAARQVTILVDGKPIEGPEAPVPSPNLTTPQGLLSEGIDEQGLSLSWEASPVEENIVRYHIYLMGTEVGTAESATFIHRSLVHGVTAQYTVAAEDNEGNLSAASEPLSVEIPRAEGQPEDLLTMFPTSDTSLNSSTTKSLGGASSFGIAGNSNIMLKFPVELIPQDKELVEAKLKLHSIREFGDAKVGFFAVTKSWTEAGATRQFANRPQNMSWESELGDWVDAEGLENGHVPQVEYEFTDDDIPNQSVIDVTTLVRSWLDGSTPNHGFLGKLMSGNTQTFASKENSVATQWPILELYFQERVPAPKNLEIIEQNQDTIRLAWDAPYGITDIQGYKVLLNGSVVAETRNNSFDYEVSFRGIRASFNVVSFNINNHESRWSNTVETLIPSIGGDLTLNAIADASLNASTSKNLGDVDSIRVATNANALIWFPVEYLPKDLEIASAKLQLRAISEFGAIKIGVFGVSNHWQEAETTRDLRSRQPLVYWDFRLGDWTDSEFVYRGLEPFGTVELTDGNTRDKVEIDVTQLVKQWYSGEMENFGLLLRRENGGIQVFGSREHANSTYHPKLLIQL
ncbi:DNRLRE domain-containing protein [Thalassotalea euphylliae]|nr:DNRLRE domain-containing protein [Thalassotalea euphylliae]